MQTGLLITAFTVLSATALCVKSFPSECPEIDQVASSCGADVRHLVRQSFLRACFNNWTNSEHRLDTRAFADLVERVRAQVTPNATLQTDVFMQTPRHIGLAKPQQTTRFCFVRMYEHMAQHADDGLLVTIQDVDRFFGTLDCRNESVKASVEQTVKATYDQGMQATAEAVQAVLGGEEWAVQVSAGPDVDGLTYVEAAAIYNPARRCHQLVSLLDPNGRLNQFTLYMAQNEAYPRD